MNGKLAKAIRKMTNSRKQYQAMKAAAMSDNGQNPKPLACRKTKPKQAIKPTWPMTVNQLRQSRPMIVMNPVRSLCDGRAKKMKREIRAECAGVAKRELDASAVRGFTLAF